MDFLEGHTGNPDNIGFTGVCKTIVKSIHPDKIIFRKLISLPVKSL
jgi:hypothetical protein